MVKCYVPHETASTCNNHQNQPEAPVTIQAKSMTPRKRPKNNSKLETSFRQVMMKPSAGVKKKFLKTTVGQTDHVISTIIKTLGVNKSSNDQSVHKKRASRKNSVPVRCSPRKKSSVEYYSSSRSLNSTNKVEKNKAIKEKTRCSLSDVLKKKLRSAIASALESNGVNIEDVIFKPCFKRLFTICQVFVQDIQGDPRKLGTSQCIQEIAEEHVKQVIKYEKKKMK
ncbi:uncharacterized protein [Parasteatoda tepidariorum]|uniref:uncharacterized protein n=1 Tax=Parasteatoda tepidariorum TaxID=114398 RepID=UPI001C721FCC|nr:uncharacterized protein LOC122272063 [Parasteatoda tepidariorum]